jgi:hypothetical protein
MVTFETPGCGSTMETIEASFFSGMRNWITNGVVFRIFLGPGTVTNAD